MIVKTAWATATAGILLLCGCLGTQQPPTDLQIASASASEVVLNWKYDNLQYTQFEIERTLDQNGQPDPNAWADTNPAFVSTLSFTDVNHATGTTYWYKVRAWWGERFSTCTQPVQAAVPQPDLASPSDEPTQGSVFAGGDDFTLAVVDGKVWTWDVFTDTPVPVQVQGLAEVVAVSAQGQHRVVLKRDGSVWAWDSAQTSPRRIQTPETMRSIDADSRGGHSVTTDGRVFRWTYDAAGEPQESYMADLTGVRALASNERWILALKEDGTVWSQGYNSSGELGIGTTSTYETAFRQVVAPSDPTAFLTGVVAIGVSGMHSLALKEDGTVWAWGNNFAGLVAMGQGTTISSPVQTSVSDVQAIAVGDIQTVFLKNDGTLWISDASDVRPHPVPGLSNVRDVGCSGEHEQQATVKESDGRLTVWRWGHGGTGPDGERMPAPPKSPTLMPIP
ncbi:MAG: hypothetical protein HYY16_16670 [Planctomycetes bacterium]|nr:hypothetical protein [Planctomycetota bacterium]